MDIEKLLEDGNVIQIKPQGWSMYPLMINGRDSAIIEPLGDTDLKRGDVVLYRRKNGVLVLHRIWKCKTEGIYLVGDNQDEIEGPLHRSQMKGRMIAVVRKGKKVSVKHPLYVLYARIWLFLRPCRPWISNVVHKLKGEKNGRS